MALAPGENTDYGFSDALKDTLLSAASMAAFTTGLGTAGDAFKAILGKETSWHLQPPQVRNVLPEAAPVLTADATTNNAAQRSALAQVIDGKPVDVADFFPKPPDTMTAVGMFTDNPYLGGNVPGAAELGLDRDQIARQLEPELFGKFDDLSSRRATLSRWYNELAAEHVPEPTAAGLNDELDALRTELQTATKARRAEIVQRIADIKEQLPTEQTGGGTATTPLSAEGPAQPAISSPVSQPLPAGSIADLDAEISRLQVKMSTANRAGREKLSNRIASLQDQQSRLAAEIGVPINTAEIGPERFEPPVTATRGATPYLPEPTNRPYSLLEFLASEGGVIDEGGDIRSMIGKDNMQPLLGRFRDRYKKLIATREPGLEPGAENLPLGDKERPTTPAGRHKEGEPMTLDQARERAWEEGYFHHDVSASTPGTREYGVGTKEAEPDIHDLLHLIEQEVRGNPVYSAHDLNQIEDFENVQAHNAEIAELAQRHGIEPKGLTRDQFMSAIAERASVEDLAREAADRAASTMPSLYG